MTKRLLIPIPLVIWLAGCAETPGEKSAASLTTAVAVSTATATNETWPSLYEATGTVRARTSAVISARLMGYVREVKVQTGDRVREGQVLVTLDTRDLDVSSRRAEAAREEIRGAVPEADSAVAAAKANLDLAQVTFGRMQDLFRKKSISNQEFDEASAKLKAAQAAYDMAQARRAQLISKISQADQEVRATEVTRSYADVVAPFAGVVVAKSVDPGTLALPGAPLFTIEREGALSPGSVGGRVAAGGDSSWTAGVGHSGRRRSRNRCAGFRDRARGGCGLASLHRQDRSARDSGASLGRVRTRGVPARKPAGAGDPGSRGHRTRPVAIGAGGGRRNCPHPPDHHRAEGSRTGSRCSPAWRPAKR